MENANAAALIDAFDALSKSAAMIAAALKAEDTSANAPETSAEKEELSAEKVRGMLSAKAADGYKTEVKRIVNLFGKNFTAVDPTDYPAIVEELKKLPEKVKSDG